jgi:hypothetical protein
MLDIQSDLRDSITTISDWSLIEERNFGSVKFELSLRGENTEWNSSFLAFSFTIEGSTEKVLQFIMPFKSIYSKNLCVIEQKMYF